MHDSQHAHARQKRYSLVSLVLDRDQVRRLRKEGKSLREISDTMGLSLTTTARILKTA
jgi:hypothetical protein